MEEQAPQPSPSVQPVQPASVAPEKKPGVLILAISLIAILLVAGGVYAGMRIGKNSKLKTQISKPNLKSQNLTPTEAPVVTSAPTFQPEITPLPDDTANWKSYTSVALGFTFNYPSEYNSPEERENYLSLISPPNPDRGKGFELQNSELKVEIITEEAKEDNSPTKCFNDYNSSGGKIIGQSEITISGINTTIIDWEGYGSGQFICTPHNNKRYLINKYPLETTRQAEFDQILSTFKFTE